jgi:deazaflavin-dependent oxidoreductase (nitroreductase family)
MPLWTLLMDAHTAAYRFTRGRFGHTWPGQPPILLLDHVGARSGQQRTSPLAYVRDGEAYVLIASKGGHPRNPSWFHNLLAHPDTTIQVGNRRLQVRARKATPQERERLWPRAVEAHAGYADYQARTSREIPLVLLEPRGS